jgi:hypothetical protein
MSDFENPWQSPENAGAPEKPPLPRTALTDVMLRYLREASPWMRFVGILGFIGCGLMFAGGIITSIAAFAAAGFAGEFDVFPMEFFGPLYVVFGVVMFFPARFTYFFGAKLRDYGLNNSERELEDALKNNKSLWKFYGILCIVYLALIPVAIIGGIIAAAYTI